MSGANSWLSRQRKSDLTELAQHTGLKNYDGLKKTELELALDEYIGENANQFTGDPKLASYFSSRARSQGSPIKKDLDGSADKLKVARRRTTTTTTTTTTKPTEETATPETGSEEPENETSEQETEQEATATSTALVATPGRALSLARRIPLPATPADVAEAVDRSTVAIRTRAVSIYKESGIAEVRNKTRDSLSSVNAVLLAVSLFELYFLRSEVLPDRYAGTIPAIKLLGTPSYPVHIPDIFLVLSSSFWSPFGLWLLTSTLLPSVVGYFVNMTAGAHAHHGRVTRRSAPASDYVVDPLTFSIVKAVLSFVVYGQGITFGGWVHEQSITRVNSAVYGGYKGVLVGAAITGIFSMYDAVLKK